MLSRSAVPGSDGTRHRDYRVVTPPEVTAGLCAPGATEHTHGLTSTLLSNVAVRAGDMVDSIAALRDAKEQVVLHAV